MTLAGSHFSQDGRGRSETLRSRRRFGCPAKGTPRKINILHLKIMIFNRNLLFQRSILRFHVNLPGCTLLKIGDPVTIGIETPSTYYFGSGEHTAPPGWQYMLAVGNPNLNLHICVSYWVGGIDLSKRFVTTGFVGLLWQGGPPIVINWVK